MNILVTGANGQLGNEMRILAKDSTNNYIFTDVVTPEGVETTILDITDLDAVKAMVKENAVDCIVNCAAYTNVDAAESNEELAELLNAKAPENLAIAMKEVDGLLVHVSTDYVFGGDPYNTPCKEDQKGTPTGVYGLTKLHGEQNIIATGCKHIIIRTAWLYSEFGKNFVKTMLTLGQTRDSLNVVVDQVGTPTYALDLANAIKAIITAEQWIPGTYHFSDEGATSWYDFTKAIHRIAGIKTCDVHPCMSNQFPAKAARPHYSVLDKTKIKATYGITIPYWEDSLKHCLKRLNEHE